MQPCSQLYEQRHGLVVGRAGAIGHPPKRHQHALGLCLDRKQGKKHRAPMAPARFCGSRCMCAYVDDDEGRKPLPPAPLARVLCQGLIDMTSATGQSDGKAPGGFLDPDRQAFGTDTGMGRRPKWVLFRLHGGMALSRKQGSAQYSRRRAAYDRDLRRHPMASGNGSGGAQEMMDGGEASNRLLDEIEADGRSGPRDVPEIGGRPVGRRPRRCAKRPMSWNEHRTWDTALCRWRLPYLRAFARVLGAHLHLKAAFGRPKAARR